MHIYICSARNDFLYVYSEKVSVSVDEIFQNKSFTLAFRIQNFPHINFPADISVLCINMCLLVYMKAVFFVCPLYAACSVAKNFWFYFERLDVYLFRLLHLWFIYFMLYWHYTHCTVCRCGRTNYNAITIYNYSVFSKVLKMKYLHTIHMYIQIWTR